MCTHGCQTMVKETSKTTNFWACFFSKMFVYWSAIPLISTMYICLLISLFQTVKAVQLSYFYWHVYLRPVKVTNKSTTLLAHFVYKTLLYTTTLTRQVLPTSWGKPEASWITLLCNSLVATNTVSVYQLLWHEPYHTVWCVVNRISDLLHNKIPCICNNTTAD